MDARHPLPPAPQPAAEAELEKRQHQTHCTAGSRDETNAQQNGAHAFGVRYSRLPFPRAAHFGKKPLPRKRGFVRRLVPCVSVEPHSRGIDQNPLFGPEGLHHSARGFHPAAQDFALLRGGPQSQDRLAGKIHHRIESAEIQPAVATGLTEPRALAARERHNSVAGIAGHLGETAAHIPGRPEHANTEG